MKFFSRSAAFHRTLRRRYGSRHLHPSTSLSGICLVHGLITSLGAGRPSLGSGSTLGPGPTLLKASLGRCSHLLIEHLLCVWHLLCVRLGAKETTVNKMNMVQLLLASE